MISRLLLISSLLLFGSWAVAQPVKNQPDNGRLTLGMRSTLSTFNQGNFNHTGMGVGGHFRVRLSPRINTEWFADYITNDIQGKASRTDGHIGWSVMYYPMYEVFKEKAFTPYASAGHCFDYTKITVTGEPKNFGERWSSAVQMGLGTHYEVTERTDVSLSALYMVHLGNDLHTHVSDQTVKVVSQEGSNLESHILVTLSLNYKLIELW